jgi:CheY-like chemotaxis protein
MDCNMPIMDGFQATFEIKEFITEKQNPGDYEPKIIALTAYSTE